MGQYLDIPTPRLKLYNQSWTFEAWIYLNSITNVTEYRIMAQCKAFVVDNCFHVLVQSEKLILGFWYDDAFGHTKLAALKWYHVAFVFDCANRNQFVYLDGVIDGSHQTPECFQGYDQSLQVGQIEAAPGVSLFNGLIDEFSFTNRSKAADEILRDATLTVHFSFDDNSTYDQGPLRINGSLVGNTTFTAGRVGQALEIQNVNQSYFRVPRLVLLGTSNRSYSFSIWIQPKVQQEAVIIHASSLSDGTGWNLPPLQITDTYQLRSYSWNGTAIWVTGPVIPPNTWTHAAVTYSLSSGLKLYVNGTLSNASAPFLYSPTGVPLYLFLGSSVSSPGWGTVTNNSGQYSGALDEFRVYSRELTAADVAGLAQP